MRSHLLITTAIVMMAISVPAFAQGRSGGDNDRGRGSRDHVSSQGNANSNGRNSNDREFGRDRAKERADMNDIKRDMKDKKDKKDKKDGDWSDGRRWDSKDGRWHNDWDRRDDNDGRRFGDWTRRDNNDARRPGELARAGRTLAQVQADERAATAELNRSSNAGDWLFGRDDRR